jgi:hypothetical protein
MADKTPTRTIDINLGVTGRGQSGRIRFRLVCDARAQLVPNQIFEIVSPGRESVSMIPVGGSIVNRSDGITTVVGITRDMHFVTVLTRLRNLPNVSNMKVVEQG